MEAGCILCGTQVIIPEKLQTAVLEKLHASHPGIVRMKLLACLHVWWPGINKHIERVDAHLKWVEVILMSSTTSQNTILEVRKLLATYGLPAHLCKTTSHSLFLLNLNIS